MNDTTVKKVCYCCTCPYDKYSGAMTGWDPMCHNHGAHGIRGCEEHGVEREECDCGCND